MKIKIVVIDPELSTRAKRILAAVVVPAVLLGGAAVAWAGTLHQWYPGDTLTDTDLNANFSDLDERVSTLEGASHPGSGFRAHRTTAVAAQNTVPTIMVFDTVEFDDANEYNSATGAFTPKNVGTYLIMCSVWWPALTTGSQVSSYVYISGSFVDGTDLPASMSSRTRPQTTLLTRLAAATPVNCGGAQNSGATANTVASPEPYTSFSAVRLY